MKAHSIGNTFGRKFFTRLAVAFVLSIITAYFFSLNPYLGNLEFVNPLKEFLIYIIVCGSGIVLCLVYFFLSAGAEQGEFIESISLILLLAGLTFAFVYALVNIIDVRSDILVNHDSVQAMLKFYFIAFVASIYTYFLFRNLLR